MKTFNYSWDKVEGKYHPALYPGDRDVEKWVLPDDIRTDFGKLNSVIETKYTREFLKICAFYNKLFPSLKTANWTRSSYNTPPFTSMDQERSDTGTGISSNYLKQIVDQTVSRLGTLGFEAALLADLPTLEYIIYKDEVERLLRKEIRDDDANRTCMEVFHDASILGYSHEIIDPFTHKYFKANDYEVGLFEAQFNRSDVKQLLYRDYAFPVVSLVPYLANADKATQQKIIDDYGSNTTVDFKMYFDCVSHKVHVVLNGTALEPIAYPFEQVQMVTFSWDIGFSKVTSTSQFDLLYPVQRELNKINAKMQQLIRMYKGSIPVISGADDLVWKNISNGSGEALYITGARPATDIITVLNPTPLDSALSAEITARKTEMYELAGIQQVSFDMENMRSAAAVIALDQTRDTVFQAQIDGMSRYIAKRFRTRVNYNAAVMPEQGGLNFVDVKALLDEAVIELKPVHVNDPLGNKNAAPNAEAPDYQKMQMARICIAILKGKMSYSDISYMVNRPMLLSMVAITMVKLDAMGLTVPDTMQQFLIEAYVDDVQTGVVQL